MVKSLQEGARMQVLLQLILPHCSLSTQLRCRQLCADAFALLGHPLWQQLAASSQLQLLSSLLVTGQWQKAALLHTVLGFSLDPTAVREQALTCIKYNQLASLQWLLTEADVVPTVMFAEALLHGRRDIGTWLLDKYEAGDLVVCVCLRNAALHGDLAQLRWLKGALQLSGLQEQHRWAAAEALQVSQHLENWHICRWLWHTFHLQEDKSVLAHLGPAALKALQAKIGSRV